MSFQQTQLTESFLELVSDLQRFRKRRRICKTNERMKFGGYLKVSQKILTAKGIKTTQTHLNSLTTHRWASKNTQGLTIVHQMQTSIRRSCINLMTSE